MQPNDTRALREVLGCYGTGVALMTTHAEARGHVGVTVNSFASVSLDPPLILFSLIQSANVLPAFLAADGFAVNILASDQQEISNSFARPSTATWEGVTCTESERGYRLLTGALAHLECASHEQVQGGDHVILLGRVERFHLQGAHEPLLFFRGKYGSYVRDRWQKSPASDASLTEFSVSGWS